MAHHDTGLAVKYLKIAALSTTCKVGVWHTMKKLAGKSLTVEGFSLTLAPFNMTGKVGVWHAMTQNWQVNHTVAALNRASKVGVCHAMTQNWQVRLLVTANQWSVGGRSGDSFV